MFKLRDIEKSDLPKITKYLNCKEISETTISFPYPYTMSDAKIWYANICENRKKVAFVIEKDKQLVGIIAYYIHSKLEIELMSWVAKPFWGKSICTNAISALLKNEKVLTYTTVIGKAMLENYGAQKALLKNNFVCIGSDFVIKNRERKEVAVFQKTAT